MSLLGLGALHLAGVILAIPQAEGPQKKPPEDLRLEEQALNRATDATVVVLWRQENLIRVSLGLLVSSDGHVLFAHATRGRLSNVNAILYSGTPRQVLLETEAVDMGLGGGFSVIKLPGRDYPHFAVDSRNQVSDDEVVWVATVPRGALRFEQKTHVIEYHKVFVGKAKELHSTMKLKNELDRETSGGPVLNSRGDLVGIAGATRIGNGNALNLEAVEAYVRPRVKECSFYPRVLPVQGGPVTVRASITGVLKPVDRALALIEGDGFRQEVKLVLRSNSWTGSWICPPLDEEGRSRTELQVLMKDQTLRSTVLRKKTISLVTKDGIKSLRTDEVRCIRWDETGGRHQVVTNAGTLEGTVKLDDLGIDEAENVSSVVLDPTRGRRYTISIVGFSGNQETRSLPATVLIGEDKDSPDGIAFSAPQGPSVVRMFPGTPDRIQVCAGGKYLLIHFTNLHTLGVFDLERLEFRTHLRLERGPVLFAGGRTKLLVLYPEKARLERWSLDSLERELTIPSPFVPAPQGLVMGWNSEVALVIAPMDYKTQGAELTRFDVRRMRLLPKDPALSIIWTGYDKDLRFRVSSFGDQVTWHANGRVFHGGWVRVKEHGLFQRVEQQEFMIPGEMGAIFSSRGVLEDRGVTEDSWDLGGLTLAPRLGPGNRMIPAISGPLYLSLSSDGESQSEIRGVVRGLSGGEKILTLTFPVLESWPRPDKAPDELIPENRVFFHPRARVLVTIPASKDRLICRPLDIDALLESAGVDYLYLDSLPRTEVFTGSEWSYPLRIKSKRGSVKIHLDTAPEGMILRDGVLSWTPSLPGHGKVKVLVSDASRQELEHSFTLRVR